MATVYPSFRKGFEHFPRYRRSARRRPGAVGPHALSSASSLKMRQNLALIDWPVVLATGVLSLIMTVSMAVTIYHASRNFGNEKLANLHSPARMPAPLVTTISSSSKAVADAPRPQGSETGGKGSEFPFPSSLHTNLQTPDPLPLTPPLGYQAAVLQYPEENERAVALAAATAPKASEELDVLQKAIPSPGALPPLIPQGELGATSQAACPSGSCSGDYGTSLKFVKDPEVASQSARKEKKMVFVLHVSGNFEDAKFT